MSFIRLSLCESKGCKREPKGYCSECGDLLCINCEDGHVKFTCSKLVKEEEVKSEPTVSPVSAQ
jgi:hypothetical protein